MYTPGHQNPDSLEGTLVSHLPSCLDLFCEFIRFLYGSMYLLVFRSPEDGGARGMNWDKWPRVERIHVYALDLLFQLENDMLNNAQFLNCKLTSDHNLYAQLMDY